MKKTVLSIIFIALLFVSTLFVLVNLVKADTLISDGFESGTFGDWTNTAGSTIATSPVHSGIYSADFPLGIPDSYAIKNLDTPVSTLNYTSYVYFSGLCNDYICVIMAEDANGTIIHYRVQDVNGNYQWQFNVGNSQVINSTNPAPQAGQWYKIQLLAITGDNGTFYFLVDDQLKATITNEPFGAITQLRIGHDWDEGYIGGNSYFDDVVITQIGSPVIIASAGDGGSISPNGIVSVNVGATPTFTITANASCHIADVLVDGNSVGPLSTYTFASVQAMSVHTINASFAITPTPTPSPSPSPSPTPSSTSTSSTTSSSSNTVIQNSEASNTEASPTPNPTTLPNTSSSPASPSTTQEPSQSNSQFPWIPFFAIISIVVALVAALSVYKIKRKK